MEFVERWKRNTLKNPSQTLYKKCRAGVFPENWVENNGPNYYKFILIIQCNINLLNSFRFVCKTLNDRNALHGKTLAGSLQKMSRTCISGKLRGKNCLNCYKFILIIQCNINVFNSFRFVWKSLNDENAIHGKALRRLFTKNVAYMYFREIECERIV